MADLRRRLLRGVFRALQSDRVVKLIQNPRVMDAIIGAMNVPAKGRSALRQGGASIASALGLATASDLREVEAELARGREPLEHGGIDGPSRPPSTSIH